MVKIKNIFFVQKKLAMHRVEALTLFVLAILSYAKGFLSLNLTALWLVASLGFIGFDWLVKSFLEKKEAHFIYFLRHLGLRKFIYIFVVHFVFFIVNQWLQGDVISMLSTFVSIYVVQSNGFSFLSMENMEKKEGEI